MCIYMNVHFRLKELLRLRLKECGWRDQLKEECKGIHFSVAQQIQCNQYNYTYWNYSFEHKIMDFKIPN